MTQEEFDKVLTRAQEIQSGGGLSVDGDANHDELIKAAEEAGIDRKAVFQALRERVGFADVPLAKGDYVFALSADGDKHVAEFVKREDDCVTVKFVNGATAKLLPSAVQPFRMLPGEVVDCPWSNKGYERCTIQSYKEENKWVYVVGPKNDTRYFNLEEIRLLSDDSKLVLHPKNPWPGRLRHYGIAIGSFLVGALLMWLLHH